MNIIFSLLKYNLTTKYYFAYVITSDYKMYKSINCYIGQKDVLVT